MVLAATPRVPRAVIARDANGARFALWEVVRLDAELSGLDADADELGDFVATRLARARQLRDAIDRAL